MHQSEVLSARCLNPADVVAADNLGWRSAVIEMSECWVVPRAFDSSGPRGTISARSARRAERGMRAAGPPDHVSQRGRSVSRHFGRYCGAVVFLGNDRGLSQDAFGARADTALP